MRCSAFVLLEDNSRFLLIQEAARKWKAKWYLPGGKVDIGENIFAGAVREVREECGLDVTIDSLFFLKYYEGTDDKMVFYFKGKITGGTLKKIADKHSLTADWFALEQAAQMSLREDALKLLKLSATNTETLPASEFLIYPDKAPAKESWVKRVLSFFRTTPGVK
jgi:ADP-ribose pyrophosphatase YjhB (NUDIX family)